MKKQKVIFIGGLSNGRIVYDCLRKNKYVDLALTITYPDHTEKPRMAEFPDGPDIIKTVSANEHTRKICSITPDFIFVAGWSELLSSELIAGSAGGTIGFHPSKLPMDRGRSVLAWQIEAGYQETALTMFYYNQMPDAGDIIAQERIKIHDTDYIDDVLNKMDYATYNMMRAYFPLIRQGTAARNQQDLNAGNYRRLRNDQDLWIQWDSPAVDIYNKIRAVSKPYPGAECLVQNKKMKVWKGNVLREFSVPIRALPRPGDLVAELCDGSRIVRCRDGFIQITEYEAV